ncbi:hypothetical protein PRK78_002388 [Emydomyces testavorans]|uniref:Uncharacterized protein n=1 Tax=Emydomyces testavorans TaxID=2070801 RepID=A0AAF0DEZ9_9EURO|nr:hypothetical protein PRK78_002388 [Emydomyces testavorans]
MTGQSKGNRAYIERFLAIRMEPIKIEYLCPDYILLDIAKQGLTHKWKEFIQTRAETAARNGTDLPEEDLPGFQINSLTRKESNGLATATNAVKNWKDRKRSCNYCGSNWHTPRTCWFKNPEQATEGRQETNAQRIKEFANKSRAWS